MFQVIFSVFNFYIDIIQITNVKGHGEEEVKTGFVSSNHLTGISSCYLGKR